MSDDIVDRLADLVQQATTERSHFYVAKCAQDAIAEITRLRARVATQDRDAARYQRLRALGCAPFDSPQLQRARVLRFTSLDDFVDADLKAQPSRGEAAPSAASPSVAPQDERTAFEKWLLKHWDIAILERGVDGEYIVRVTQENWLGWRARAVLSPDRDHPADQETSK